MPRLILMRHAKSDWEAGVPDHARPLNLRGRRSAEALGRWLKTQGYLPDLALVSDARRTQETFERLDLPLVAQVSRALYLAEEDEIAAMLRGARGETVLVLGHNPGIGALAGDLVDTPPHHPRFDDYPTGATLVADLPDRWSSLGPRSLRPVDFVIPADLDQ